MISFEIIRGELTMVKRIGVFMGETEQKALNELEIAFPDWKHKNSTEKFKEMFWLGVRNAEKEKEKRLPLVDDWQSQNNLLDFGFEYKKITI